MSTDFDFVQNAVITRVEGWAVDSERIRLVTDKGMLELFHYQDCCEHVSVEDVNGEAADLLGARIVELREDSNIQSGGHGEECWTFYNLITDKGDFQIRWYGTSNGYYSIGVDHSWTAGKPPISRVLVPPFSQIRLICEDGTAWDRDGNLLMQVTAETAAELQSNYTLN